MYTVKQLSDLAGVTARTLHYYHQVGLLRPSSMGENGYRYYGTEAVLRLQQILFFREMGFALDEIGEILDQPDFDAVSALEAHRVTLEERAEKLKRLIITVEKTIAHLKGDLEMSQKDLYDGFNEEKQKQYEEEIRQRYGDKDLKESQKRWASYSKEKKEAIKAEGVETLKVLAAAMSQGPESVEVQKYIDALYHQLDYFYTPTYERFLGLSQLYQEHPDFRKTYERYHPDMPEFLGKAIAVYCQGKTGR